MLNSLPLPVLREMPSLNQVNPNFSTGIVGVSPIPHRKNFRRKQNGEARQPFNETYVSIKMCSIENTGFPRVGKCKKPNKQARFMFQKENMGLKTKP